MTTTPTRDRVAPETINTQPKRRPDWIKVRAPSGETYTQLQELMQRKSLHTVCEEAGCPNMGECWGSGTATFLMLGDVCTRSCRFCDVKHGRPDFTGLAGTGTGGTGGESDGAETRGHHLGQPR